VVSASIMILISDPTCRVAYETSKVARVTWLEALRMLSGGVILLRKEQTSFLAPCLHCQVLIQKDMSLPTFRIGCGKFFPTRRDN